MDPLYIPLLTIKYVGLILAAGYGIYATLHDFKEDRHGTKVLSRKGKLGISLLAVASLFSLSSDALSDYRERGAKRAADENEAERRKDAAQVQARITADLARSIELTDRINADLKAVNKGVQTAYGSAERAATKASDVLQEATRLQDPLVVAPFSLDVRWDYDNSDATRSYLDRVERETRAGVGRNDREPADGASFSPGDPRFPSESQVAEGPLARFARDATVMIRVFNPNRKRPGFRWDDMYLELQALCFDPARPTESHRRFSFSTLWATGPLTSECGVYDLYPVGNRNRIFSVVELLGKELFIAIGFRQTDAPRVSRPRITLANARGRRLLFGELQRGDCHNCFTRIISKSDLDLER